MRHVSRLAAPLLATALAVGLGAGQAVAQDTIRIASPYATTTLDPIRSAAAGNIETFGQLYARLLRRDANGELAPGLAESWEVSDDGRMVTVTLRDAQFSDGSPITAEDVAFSLERVRSHEESAYSAPFQQVERIEATGPKTVVFTLEAPFSPFLGNLEIFNAGIVSKADVEARGEEAAFTENVVTSGPYRVAEWRPNDRLILEANPNYWREGYPKNGGAELIEIAQPETRTAMLQSGEVDAIREVPWAQIAELEAHPDVEMPLEPSTVIFVSLLNHGREPFNDVRVRQAAAHALDIEAVANAVTFGLATPANTTLPNALLYHHSDHPGIAHDPALAKSLVEEAGATGQEVVILIPDNPEREQMAVLMQALWQQAGLSPRIEKVDGGTWWDRVVAGDYDAAPTWWYNETPDPDLAVRWALCGSCGSQSFYTNYSNPEVDELVEAGARASGAAEREDIYHRIQEITTGEVAQIPLYYPPYTNAYSTRIEGLGMTPSLQWTLEEAEVRD